MSRRNKIPKPPVMPKLPTAELFPTVDYSDPAQFRKLLKQFSKGSRDKPFIKPVNPNEWSDDSLQRRIGALTELRTTFHDRYADKLLFSDLQVTTPEEVITALNLIPICSSADNSEDENHLLYAAAVWIADQIRASENQFEFQKYAPKDGDDLFDADFLYLYDPLHDDEFIRSIVYILQFRNEDGFFYDASSYSTDGRTGKSKASKKAAESETTETANRRNNFNGLMSLIPTSAVETAVEHFTDFYWQWMDRLFECASRFAKSRDETAQTMVNVQKRMVEAGGEFQTLLKAMAREIDPRLEKKVTFTDDLYKRGTTSGNLPVSGSPMMPPGLDFGTPGSPFATSGSPVSPASPFGTPGSPASALHAPGIPGPAFNFGMLPEGGFGFNPEKYSDDYYLANELDRLQGRLNELDHKLNEQNANMLSFLSLLQRKGRVYSQAALEDAEGQDLRDLFQKPLDVPDPYELCFAFIYLVSQNG